MVQQVENDRCVGGVSNPAPWRCHPDEAGSFYSKEISGRQAKNTIYRGTNNQDAQDVVVFVREPLAQSDWLAAAARRTKANNTLPVKPEPRRGIHTTGQGVSVSIIHGFLRTVFMRLALFLTSLS